MRIIPSSPSRPLVLYLSFGIGILVLFLRILTLPRSSWAILIWEVVPALMYSVSFLSGIGTLSQGMGNQIYREIFIAAIAVLFLAILLWSLRYGLVRYRQSRSRAFIPLGMGLLNLLLFISLHQIVVLPDFLLHQSDRQAAISWLEAEPDSGTMKNNRTVDVFHSGKLPKHQIATVSLPAQYQDLSAGFYLKGNGRPDINPGDVEVVRRENGSVRAIIFFRSSGLAAIGPVYTAFVYKPEDSPVVVEDLFDVAGLTFYLGIDAMKKLQPHWYWVDVSED
jgi:hypothetical protein